MASAATWAAALTGMTAALVLLCRAYADGVAHPVLVRDVFIAPALPLPVLTLCSSVLGIPAFSRYPTATHPGDPLFTVRAVIGPGAGPDETAVYPESLDAVEELSLGPAGARCEEGGSGVDLMDSAAMNRFTGVPSGVTSVRRRGGRNETTAPPRGDGPVPGEVPGLELGALRPPSASAGLCAACFRLGRSPQLVLNGTAAAAGADMTVRVEVVASQAVESCIFPTQDMPLTRIMVFMELIYAHSEGLVAAGVLNYNGAPRFPRDSERVYHWLTPPKNPILDELKLLAGYEGYLSFLCNTVLFSGYFYPAVPGIDIRYRLDWRGDQYPCEFDLEEEALLLSPGAINESELPFLRCRYPVWRALGSGPHFQPESSLRAGPTKALSTRSDAAVLDLLVGRQPSQLGTAPDPYIDVDGFQLWRQATLSTVYGHFVSVYAQDQGDVAAGGAQGRLRLPNREDLVRRVEVGPAIVRLSLKRVAGYGNGTQLGRGPLRGGGSGRRRRPPVVTPGTDAAADDEDVQATTTTETEAAEAAAAAAAADDDVPLLRGGAYVAERMDRLLLEQPNDMGRATNTSYVGWLLEFTLELYVVESYTRRVAWGASLFVADLFNVIGVFTGISAYTLVVLPGTLILARSVRARQRAARAARGVEGAPRG